MGDQLENPNPNTASDGLALGNGFAPSRAEKFEEAWHEEVVSPPAQMVTVIKHVVAIPEGLTL